MRSAPKTGSQTNGLWAARKCIELDAEVTSYVDLSDLDNLHLGMAVAGGVWTMVVYNETRRFGFGTGDEKTICSSLRYATDTTVLVVCESVFMGIVYGSLLFHRAIGLQPLFPVLLFTPLPLSPFIHNASYLRVDWDRVMVYQKHVLFIHP